MADKAKKHSKIALDLKHFKHIKSDDKSTTLQHKNGHMLTLAHKSLHPDAQAQLAALSKIASEHATDEQADEMKHKMAKGGNVKSEGEKEKAIHGQQQLVNKHEEEKGYHHKDTRKELKKLNKMKGYAEGGGVEENQQHSPLDTIKKLAPLAMMLSEGGKVPKKGKYCADCGNMAHGGECPPERETPDGAGIPYFDEGGTVNRDKNKEGARAVKEDAQKGGPTLAQGWQNIKNAFSGKGPAYEANGGKVSKVTGDMPQMPGQDMLEGIGTSIDKAMYQAPVVPTVPENVQAKRDLYNQMVGQNLMQTGGSADSVKPFQFQPGSNNAPADFDPNLWKKASDQYDAQLNYKAIQGQKDAARQQAQNGALAQAGVDVVPGTNTVPPSITPPVADQLPPQATMSPQATPEQPATASTPSDPLAQYQKLLQTGYQNQVAGLQAGAKAQEQQGQQEAQALQQQVAADQVAKNAFQSSYKELEDERKDTVEDIRNNLINPEHYWENHSKIAAGIGMILAGFNPTGRPNAAIEFLNNQINRDIEAQSKNLQARDNLLSHNLQHFGDLRNAAEMTRLQMLDMVNHQLGVAAAQAKGPMAKASALQAQGQLQQQMAPLQMNLALSAAMMKLQNAPNGGMPAGTNPTAAAEALLPALRVQKPEMARELESRLIPGVGIAATPIPQHIRDNVTAMTTLDNKAKDLLHYAEAHKGSVNPNVLATGRQKAEELLNFYNASIQGGVLTEGRLEWLDKQVPKNPTTVFQDILGSNAKLKEIMNSNQQRRDQLLQSVGIRQPQQSIVGQDLAPEQQQKLQIFMKKNPSIKDPNQALQILRQHKVKGF